jgi:hypothetical protein
MKVLVTVKRVVDFTSRFGSHRTRAASTLSRRFPTSRTWMRPIPSRAQSTPATRSRRCKRKTRSRSSRCAPPASTRLLHHRQGRQRSKRSLPPPIPANRDSSTAKSSSSTGRADRRIHHRLRRPRRRQRRELPQTARASGKTSSARQWGPRARQSMPASCRTIIRSARPAKSSPRSSTSQSAAPVCGRSLAGC